MKDTLRHKILENFDVAIGSSGMPGSEVYVRRVHRWQRKTLSHMGVYVNGSGAFGDKARPKDK